MSTTRRNTPKSPFGRPVHGTVNCYVNYGCRCTRCTKAQAAYQKVMRAKRNARLNGAA